MPDRPTRRTYEVIGDTLHITDPLYVNTIEYSLAYLDSQIEEHRKNLAVYEAYRQRILDAQAAAAAGRQAGAVGGAVEGAVGR